MKVQKVYRQRQEAITIKKERVKNIVGQHSVGNESMTWHIGLVTPSAISFSKEVMFHVTRTTRIMTR